MTMQMNSSGEILKQAGGAILNECCCCPSTLTFSAILTSCTCLFSGGVYYEFGNIGAGGFSIARDSISAGKCIYDARPAPLDTNIPRYIWNTPPDPTCSGSSDSTVMHNAYGYAEIEQETNRVVKAQVFMRPSAGGAYFSVFSVSPAASYLPATLIDNNCSVGNLVFKGHLILS